MNYKQILEFNHVKTTQYDGAGYFSDLDEASAYKVAIGSITETHYIYASFDYHLCTIEHVVFTKHSNNPKNPVKVIGSDWNLLYVKDEEGFFKSFNLREDMEDFLSSELCIKPVYNELVNERK